jgi:hypothetical protein
MQHLETELAGLLDAVSILSRQQRFDPSDMERLVDLYNQAIYLFTYIEGNAKYVETGEWSAVKSALLDDFDLRNRLAHHVQGLIERAGTAARQWKGAIDWFVQAPQEMQAAAEARQAIRAIEDVLTRIDCDRDDLLARLGLCRGGSRGPDPLAIALRNIHDREIRSKFLLAWCRVGEAHAGMLAESVDHAVELRWRHAKIAGDQSVAGRGFSRCDVSAETVHAFLDAYADHALHERQEFLSRFDNADMCDDRIRASCPRSSKIGDSERSVNLELGALLAFAAETAFRVFGIRLSAKRGSSGTVCSLDVSRGAETLGTLALDRAHAGASGLVLGSEGEPTIPKCPRARILCLLDPRDGTGEFVSLEASRQILHAMGHALIYLAAPLRAPSASGLDVLPLERLEGLSHWFEELMNSDVFADFVVTSSLQKAALKAFCEERKDRLRNTRLEQAVVAMVDLDIHERRGLRVTDAFDARIAAMGGTFGVSFERVVRFMVAPLFRDHPGMGFVYPWGAAFGASEARPRGGLHSETLSLAQYFDPTAKLKAPNASAEFSTATHFDHNRNA